MPQNPYTTSSFAGVTDAWWEAAERLLVELGPNYAPCVHAAAELRQWGRVGPGEFLGIAASSPGLERFARKAAAGTADGWFEGRVIVDDSLDIEDRKADGRDGVVSTGPIPALVVKIVSRIAGPLGETVACLLAPVPPTDADRYSGATQQPQIKLDTRTGSMEVPG